MIYYLRLIHKDSEAVVRKRFLEHDYLVSVIDDALRWLRLTRNCGLFDDPRPDVWEVWSTMDGRADQLLATGDVSTPRAG